MLLEHWMVSVPPPSAPLLKRYIMSDEIGRLNVVLAEFGYVSMRFKLVVRYSFE
jgi:hypothetical protein